MENIDIKTLVHVGVEVVIIGGLTFWFQKKTSLQQEEINNLRSELSKAKEVINRQGKILSQHEEILKQLLNGNSNMFTSSSSSAVNQQQQQHPHHNNGHPPSHHHHQYYPPGNKIDVTQSDEIGHSSHSSRNPHGHNVIEQEDTLDEELDNLLKEELGNINESRNPVVVSTPLEQSVHSSPESMEIDCDVDGVCKIKRIGKHKNKDGVKKKAQKRKIIEK
jgi:hypothetical protein